MIWRWFMLALALQSMSGAFANETNEPATNAPATIKSHEGKTSSTNSPARNDFEGFRIIAQRNIFNPNRSNRASRSEGGESSREQRKSDSVSLVGTMLYEKGNFAFFEGSRSEYRKVLKPEDSIVGYKITDVSPTSVKLEGNGKTLELAVGQQLKKQDEGNWIVSGRAADESSSPSSSNSSSGSSSASSGEDDEVLKKLLKKREEEASK